MFLAMYKHYKSCALASGLGADTSWSSGLEIEALYNCVFLRVQPIPSPSKAAPATSEANFCLDKLTSAILMNEGGKNGRPPVVV